MGVMAVVVEQPAEGILDRTRDRRIDMALGCRQVDDIFYL
jgi:hypothetical protein